MCDETLQSCESLFVPENVIRLARAEDCKGLLEVEAAQCLLPAAGSVFRRSFFEKVNGLSKDYYLIEDYTTHLRALRQNIVPYWTDVVSVKHRAGGISHGNKHNGALLYARYQHDFVTAFEREIEPYKDRISPAAYAKALDLYRYNLRAYKDALRKVRQVQRIVKPEEEKHLTSLPRRVFLAAYGHLHGFCRSDRMLDNLKAIAFLLLCAVLWQMGPAGALMVEGVRLLRLLTVLMTAVLVMRLAVNFWLRLCKWQEERMPRE